MKKLLKMFYFIFIVLLSSSSIQSGQSSDEFSDLLKDAPKIFIDYDHIDMDYVKKNVTFVNYVTSSELADIYVLVTTNQTGSGGREYM